MPKDLKEFLDRRLLDLAGAAITPGSLMVGAAFIVAAAVIANLLAMSARRVLRARGTAQGVQFAFAKIVRYSVLAIGFIAAINAMAQDMEDRHESDRGS